MQKRAVLISRMYKAAVEYVHGVQLIPGASVGKGFGKKQRSSGGGKEANYEKWDGHRWVPVKKIGPDWIPVEINADNKNDHVSDDNRFVVCSKCNRKVRWEKWEKHFNKCQLRRQKNDPEENKTTQDADQKPKNVVQKINKIKCQSIVSENVNADLRVRGKDHESNFSKPVVDECNSDKRHECQFCGMQIPQVNLLRHQAMHCIACVKCKGCNRIMSKNEYHNHSQKCGKFTLKQRKKIMWRKNHKK